MCLKRTRKVNNTFEADYLLKTIRPLFLFCIAQIVLPFTHT